MTDRTREDWQKAICLSALPAPTKAVAHAIAPWTGDESGQQGVWLASSDLAKYTGLKSLSTVNTHLRRLAEAGWLRRNDWAWYLTWPGEMDFTTPAAAPGE